VAFCIYRQCCVLLFSTVSCGWSMRNWLHGGSTLVRLAQPADHTTYSKVSTCLLPVHLTLSQYLVSGFHPDVLVYSKKKNPVSQVWCHPNTTRVISSSLLKLLYICALLLEMGVLKHAKLWNTLGNYGNTV